MEWTAGMSGVFRRLFGSRTKGASFPRRCSLCGYEGWFRPAGRPQRIDVRCPRCGSTERSRLMALWLNRHVEWLKTASVLHFAPEREMQKLLRGQSTQYISADLTPGRGDRVLNIEAIDSPDASFDCIVCSHVLEHVDDRRALKEMHRILKPDGVALIMLPVIEGWARTWETDAAKTPEDRKRHFGQADHLRLYGADIRDRIRDAEFSLDEFTAEGEDVLTYGLQRGEKLFIARKVAGVVSAGTAC
jgi:SAM-dependent methyltransferase